MIIKSSASSSPVRLGFGLVILSILLLCSNVMFERASGDTSLPAMINIGAILQRGDERLIDALRIAVDHVNRNRIVLPRTKLNITAYTVDPDDSFNAAKLVCKLLHEKVWTLFSPHSDSVTWYMRSIANEMQIPHLELNWNYRASYLYNINDDRSPTNGKLARSPSYVVTKDPNGSGVTTLAANSRSYADLRWLGQRYGQQMAPLSSSSPTSSLNHSSVAAGNQKFPQYPEPPPDVRDFTANLFPEANQLSSAFADFVLARNWKSFTLIYDRDEGLIMLRDLLRINAIRLKMKIRVLRFPEQPPSTKMTPTPGESFVRNSPPILSSESPLRNVMDDNIGRRRKLPPFASTSSPAAAPSSEFDLDLDGPNSHTRTGYFDNNAMHHRKPSHTAVVVDNDDYDDDNNDDSDDLDDNAENGNNNNNNNNNDYYVNHHHPRHSHRENVHNDNDNDNNDNGEEIDGDFRNYADQRSTRRRQRRRVPALFRHRSHSDSPPSSQRPKSSAGPNLYLYQKMLKNLRKTEHNYVLSLSDERTINFLRQALKAKRMSEYDNFLIASLDFHRFDLREFQRKTLANITGLSLLSSGGQDDFGMTSRQTNAAILDSFRSGPVMSTDGDNHNTFGDNRNRISTAEALTFDAVSLFARSLDDLDRALSPDEIVPPLLDCDDSHHRGWSFGAHLANYMKKIKMNGITGKIAFDERGNRVNFTLDVMQLKHDGLMNVAKWSKENGITSTANFTFYDSYKQILESMKYKIFHVSVPANARPYIYLKENHHEFHGNDKFEGFCVDLLKKITEVFQTKFFSDFKYEIKVVADLKYGQLNKETGEWNGIFGELRRHQADLAIGDLTATYLRETAVDFTMPFMNLGIAILFKKPAVPDPELFSFLKPLSVEVWLYLASAFLGISIMFWLLSRISPYEWASPHSCDMDPLELENQFSIGNSLWFAIGSLMQQGSDLAPKALSTRLLASVWWFFTLIMISSYTANLAASLTLSRMAPAISNVEDLAKQTMIQYGCRSGGSTADFFRNSNHTTYQRMYNTMQSNPEVYIDELDEAIERVRKGGYAYLAESSTIDYLVERKCDLYQVGTWLDSKGYGIATPPDSPYRTPISNAIVVLQDEGWLYALKKRWWVHYGGGLCVDDSKAISAMELNIESVGGVFVVLVGGVVIGCMFGVLEFVWKSLKVARHERESIGKLIWFEVVRICTGGSSSRPIYQAQTSTATLNNTPAGVGAQGPAVNVAPPPPAQTSSNPATTTTDPTTSAMMMKSPSFTSMAGGFISPNANNNQDNYINSPPRYNVMSPPPPPHPFQQQQQSSPPQQRPYQNMAPYSSYDGSSSTAPLLGAGSGNNKSLPRNINAPGPKSPSAFSSMY